MEDVNEQIKMRAFELSAAGRAEEAGPGTFGAGLRDFDWRKALDGLDDVLDKYKGPIRLIPGGAGMIAEILAKFIDIADEKVNGPDA